MKRYLKNDSGIALIMVLLLMLVFTVLMLGFYFETTGEQSVAASDRDNAQTFYAAQGAIENMSSQMESFFATTASPTPSEVQSKLGTPPSIPIYNALGQSTSMTISFPVYTIANLATPATTNPTTPACTPNTSSLCSTPGLITGSGPLAGLNGILTPFLLTVVADGPAGTEVKMSRQVQAVAVPVFQFGIFSTTDLSFFAGPNFGFGGKTATNGNIYLLEGSGSTLTLNDKVSAYLNVITGQLSNGTTAATGSYTGTVDITVGEANGCPGASCASLTQGSVKCPSTCAAWTPNTNPPEPPWTANSSWSTISTGTGSGDFNGYIKDGNGGSTGGTGAKQLNLVLTLAGAQPIAMVERPCPTSTTSPCTSESPSSTVGQQRFFNQASMRILLSDQQSDITEYSTTQGVTSTPEPYPLAEVGSIGMSNVIQRTSTGTAYYLPATDSCHPAMAESPGNSAGSNGTTADSDYYYTSGTTLLGGYIKIEIQLSSNPGTWMDVTPEILSLGISRDIQEGGTLSPTGCTNTSIIHLEEKRPWPNMGAPTVPSPSSGGSLTSSDKYCFVVTATGPWGEVPGTETCDSTATSSSKKEIALSWSAYSYSGVTGYNIYCGTSSGAESVYYSVASTSTSDTITSCSTSTAPTGTAGTPPTTNLTTEASVQQALNFIPINMYDPREGEVRDITCPTCASPQTEPTMNGIMNMVEIDVGHLQQWFAGKLVPPYSTCTGTNVLSPLTGTVNSCGPLALGATPSSTVASPPQSGDYILYVSDRRNNCSQTTVGPCAAGNDTGQYGYEDVINPSSGTGTPNGTLDNGEDTNGNGVLDVYGGIARPLSCASIDTTGSTYFPTGQTTTKLASSSSCAFSSGSFMANLASPTSPSAAPLTRITSAASGTGYYEAQKNAVIFARHAVRLVDGALGNLPPYSAATLTTCPNMETTTTYPSQAGFSVATENPLYIWGDYNAVTTNANGFTKDETGECHIPSAVFADSVTLLSNNWTDAESFTNPTNPGNRPASTATWFRTAVIAGKNMSFPLPTFTSPSAPPDDFGTDGGVHNFLRYLEGWGTTLNYLGAMVSFYYSVYSDGVYKCCNTVYSAPTRSYGYDSDFTNIGSLPPGTPRFTTVNALSYQQAVLATQ